MTSDFNPATINWNCFATFLHVTMVVRQQSQKTVARQTDLSVDTVRRALNGHVLKHETYCDLCDWMREADAAFLMDLETGFCVAGPSPEKLREKLPEKLPERPHETSPREATS